MTRGPLRAWLEAIAGYDGTDLDLLARLVQGIRSRRGEGITSAGPRFKELIAILEGDPALRIGLSAYVRRVTKGIRIHRTLTDAGMPSGDFWHELRRRLSYKILPPQPEEGTSDHLLVNVFFRERDADWVDALPDADCERLLDLLGVMRDDASDNHVAEELVFSAEVLGLRIAGRAFDEEVMRMVPAYENLNNPFVALADEMDDHIERVRQGGALRHVDNEGHRQMKVLMTQCHGLIEQAYRNTATLGMGFSVNQQLITMERMLERLEMVLDLLAIDPARTPRSKQVQLFKLLVRVSSGSTRVLGYIDRSTQVIAREVTGHAGRKGEHYITTTAGEYGAMLRSALGGGAIVAFACIFKAWLGTVEASPFAHAMLYSLNYAWAFITIYLLHLTLATKQPAMTASTIAATLDAGRRLNPVERYAALSDLFARVWRSQFIAFVGNVLMAFPVAVALAYAWNALFGPELLEHKSAKMVLELDPFASLALLHAGIAGVFLFLSGLIAGSVTNRSIHGRVPQRIAAHPALKFFLSDTKRTALANFYEKHAGGILSNLWFGVFMGSVGMVGAFFGLPLDIRHITFAAGNLGLALVGMDWHMTSMTVVMSVLGIGLIGFMNFIVSFGLSLALALRSRGVSVVELLPIILAVWRYFLHFPLAFFFPQRMVVPGVPQSTGAGDPRVTTPTDHGR